MIEISAAHPRPGQRGHLRGPCAGCLPHRLGAQRYRIGTNFASRAATALASVPFVRRGRPVGAPRSN